MSQQFIDADREDKWSASSAERVHYCPGSVALINSIPAEQRQSEPTEAAESGTRIHEAMETGDDSELEMNEVEIKERLDVLEKQAVEQWHEYVVSIGGRFAPPMRESDSIREERLWVKDDAGNIITSAKLDVYYLNYHHGVALDFKTGWKPTTAAQRNLQAKVQAVALWYAFGLTHVRVIIAQHRFTSLVTAADYTEEDLQRAYQEILTDDWKSKEPDAPRVPGDWCAYCPAKAHCPEAITYAMMPSSVMIRSSSATTKEILLAVDTLSTKQLAYVERRRGISEKIFDACKARLKSLPQDELARVGFELAMGRSQPECKNPNGLCDLLIEMELLKEEEILPMFNFVAGRMEELVLPRYVAKNGVTAEKAKKELRALLETAGHMDYTTKKTAPILKQIS